MVDKTRGRQLWVGIVAVMVGLLFARLFWGYPNFFGPPGSRLNRHNDIFIFGPIVFGVILIWDLLSRKK